MRTLELSPDDIIVYGDDGIGVWLTRAKPKPKPRPFNKVAYQTRVLKDADVLEAMWKPVLIRFFGEQGRVVAKRMLSRSRRFAKHVREVRKGATIDQIRADANARAAEMIDDVFSQEDFAAALRAEVESLYDDVGAIALDGMEFTFGVAFDVHARSEVMSYLAGRANQLTGNVSQTTYDLIQQMMADGIADGKSIPDIADLIQSVFASSDARAELIARTEVISSYNGAVYEGGNTLPPEVAAGLMWISTQDERTRPAHLEADGQIVAIGAPFIIDGEEMRYPGDPDASPENVINCRCCAAILTPDDIDTEARVSVAAMENLLVEMALHGWSYRQALRELRGDVNGHEFHGNQWSDAASEMVPLDADTQALYEAHLSGYVGGDVQADLGFIVDKAEDPNSASEFESRDLTPEDIRTLYASQSEVDPYAVKAMKGDMGDVRPVLATLDGRTVILDGHHRILAAAERGDSVSVLQYTTRLQSDTLEIDAPVQSFRVAPREQRGDQPGHEFHGNQWTSGITQVDKDTIRDAQHELLTQGLPEGTLSEDLLAFERAMLMGEGAFVDPDVRNAHHAYLTHAQVLNRALRDGKGEDERDVALLDRIFTQPPAQTLSQDTVLFRGSHSSRDLGPTLSLGDTFRDRGYVSASLSGHAASWFSGPLGRGDEDRTMYRIAVASDHPVIGGVVGESEWVLPRDSQFTVTGVQECMTSAGGTHRIVDIRWDGP